MRIFQKILKRSPFKCQKIFDCKTLCYIKQFQKTFKIHLKIGTFFMKFLTEFMLKLQKWKNRKWQVAFSTARLLWSKRLMFINKFRLNLSHNRYLNQIKYRQVIDFESISQWNSLFVKFCKNKIKGPLFDGRWAFKHQASTVGFICNSLLKKVSLTLLLFSSEFY